MTGSSTPLAPAAFSYPGHGANAGIGVAICHGFTGSPLSVLPWAEHLAARGFAVSVPLLPGHGTGWRDLARHGWRDWYDTFEKAYLELAAGTRACYVAGLSMGGTIALRTAARQNVTGVAVVNPGLSFYDRRVRFVGLLKHFRPTTVPAREDNPAAATTDDGDYSLTPLAAVHQLRRLFMAALRDLPAVHAPTLVFTSDTDAVIPPSSLKLLRKRLGSRELDVVRLPGSGHVATLDVDAPLIFEQSLRFFLQHADTGAMPTTPQKTMTHTTAEDTARNTARSIVGDPMSILPDHSPFSSPFTGDGLRTGVVVSHGFTGSPHGVRAWAQSLAEAGYAVRMPLLPGHGTSWQELASTRWHEWHAALDAAYLELADECEQVVVAGLSMGGALALRIAATRPVAGAVVVNPGLVIDDPRAPLAGILKLVLKSTPAIANDILKPGSDEGAYPRTPVAAAHELNKMFKDTVRLLPRVTAPVRVYRSTVDHVVSDSSMVALRRGLRNAPLEVVRLENSYHVATMDNDAPEIFRGTAEFIRSLAEDNPGAAHASQKDTADD